VDPLLLREQQGLGSPCWVVLDAAQAGLAGRLS
jgi:hypothetical protein